MEYGYALLVFHAYVLVKDFELPCLFLLNPAEDDTGFFILEASSPITLSFRFIKVGSACIPGEKERPPATSGLFVRDLGSRGLRGLPGGALPGSFAIILTTRLKLRVYPCCN